VSLSLSDPSLLAAELDAARLRCRAIGPPAELASLSLYEAYDVQDAVAGRRERAGTRRSGWKLGLTSRVKQRLMGIDHPLFGRLFASGFVASGCSVAWRSFVRPRAEPELAFGLAAPLDPDAEIRAQLDAVAWLAPALEITDSRYVPGERSAVELVADNTSASAYVLGPRTPLEGRAKLEAIDAQLLRNGVVLAAGMSADVLGDPLAALTLLARHLRDRGLRTAAGDVVLSGAITDAFPAVPGDSFEARLDGFGTAAVSFV
jgi:2-oxo-3-hexenedioate decarboxylase